MQTRPHRALVMVWRSVQMGSWLRASSWWGYARRVLRATRIQGVLGATSSPPGFAGSETKTYLEQSCPPAGDDYKSMEGGSIVWISWQWSRISWGMGCQIFHIPPREDSQAAVVYIALCFREDMLMDEAWEWDQLLPLWLGQLFLT